MRRHDRAFYDLLEQELERKLDPKLDPKQERRLCVCETTLLRVVA
jgi:hypothetical protein